MSAHKTVIVDEIFQMLEAAKSSIVPGSVCQSIVSGVQNVPTSIVQHTMGGSSGAAFTTFPLSPIIKNCCIDKTYLNLEFDVNLNMTFTGLTSGKAYEFPFYIGFRDSFSLFNQMQFLIENSVIWSTTYAREESVNSYNSLPETEIRGNPQYSSIDKMREGKKSPMKREVVSFTAADTSATIRLTEHFKITVDINRLSPIFSNMSFTTPHMGNLRLKVFIQNLERAMFFCPDYNYNCWIVPSDVDTAAKVAELNGQPSYNQYWSFYPLAFYQGDSINNTVIPFIGYNTTDKAIFVPSAVTISNPTAITGGPDEADFMTFAGSGIAEIVQTNFDIFDDDYRRLTDHFASLGSVIIPTQTWSTNVFNNSLIKSGQGWNPTMIGTVGGYSIDLIGVWAHPADCPCCFSKEFLTNIQLLLEGRPINAVQYPYENDKFLTDCVQAIIDTDHEEINKDYVDSVAFLNLTDTDQYLPSGKTAANLYGIPISSNKPTNTIRKCFLSNPNTFAMYFSTNLPDCFRSGACNLETTNRQAVLRLNSTESGNVNLKTPTTSPIYLNHTNSDTEIGFSCLCDCVIVLNYDATRGTCFDGSYSWAAPYV